MVFLAVGPAIGRRRTAAGRCGGAARGGRARGARGRAGRGRARRRRRAGRRRRPGQRAGQTHGEEPVPKDILGNVVNLFYEISYLAVSQQRFSKAIADLFDIRKSFFIAGFNKKYFDFDFEYYKCERLCIQSVLMPTVD